MQFFQNCPCPPYVIFLVFEQQRYEKFSKFFAFSRFFGHPQKLYMSRPKCSPQSSKKKKIQKYLEKSTQNKNKILMNSSQRVNHYRNVKLNNSPSPLNSLAAVNKPSSSKTFSNSKGISLKI